MNSESLSKIINELFDEYLKGLELLKLLYKNIDDKHLELKKELKEFLNVDYDDVKYITSENTEYKGDCITITFKDDFDYYLTYDYHKRKITTSSEIRLYDKEDIRVHKQLHNNIIKNGNDAMGLDYLLECGDR